MTQERTSSDQVWCDAGEHVTDQPHIVIIEGGNVLDKIICVDDLNAIGDADPDEFTRLTDLAAIGLGHICSDYGEVRGLEPFVECSLCNAVLQDVPVQSFRDPIVSKRLMDEAAAREAGF